MNIQNGVSTFILPCKRLDFHYCDWAGSSRGMKSVLSTTLDLLFTIPHSPLSPLLCHYICIFSVRSIFLPYCISHPLLFISHAYSTTRFLELPFLDLFAHPLIQLPIPPLSHPPAGHLFIPPCPIRPSMHSPFSSIIPHPFIHPSMCLPTANVLTKITAHSSNPPSSPPSPASTPPSS